MGSPGFNLGQSGACTEVSFPRLCWIFTFLFHYLGQGPALGHLIRTQVFSTSKAKVLFEISAAEGGLVQGLQHLRARSGRVTLLGLDQGPDMLALSWSSWQAPCGASQGWDIPRLWWLCLGRWQCLAGETGDRVSLESFCPLALLLRQKQPG